MSENFHLKEILTVGIYENCIGRPMMLIFLGDKLINSIQGKEAEELYKKLIEKR